MTRIEQLIPVARRAWDRLVSDFPLWVAYLNVREGELEFSIPAPSSSTAGHLVAHSNGDQLWVRFSPPHMCYPADDEIEMVWLIKELTSDNIVFKVVTKGNEWVETTLTMRTEKCEAIPGHSVRLVSWSGKFDN